jgi:hypothetical protein
VEPKVYGFIFPGLDDLVAEPMLNDTERIAKAMATHNLAHAAWKFLPRDEQLRYLNEFSPPH